MSEKKRKGEAQPKRAARVAAGAGAGLCAALTAAAADSISQPNPFAMFAEPDAAVLAVETPFGAQGGRVRLIVYDSKETFLGDAAAKFEAEIDAEGVAIVRLGPALTGDLAFVAYFDENGDGKLNRNMIGKPKEPYAFSNGVRPRLRRPKFSKAKVAVEPGAVLILSIDD